MNKKYFYTKTEFWFNFCDISIHRIKYLTDIYKYKFNYLYLI